METDLRLWFAKPKNFDEYQEAICTLHALCEEMLLIKSEFMIEVHVKKRLPQNKTVAEAAGETS
jgi:hypothetical protein